MRTPGDRFQTVTSKERFDEASQRDVLEIASRLQKYHLETLSADEVEQAAIEGGMSPEFVREAIRQVSTAPRELGEETEEKKVTKSDWAIVIFVPLIVFSVLSLKLLPHHGFTKLGAFVMVFGVWALLGLVSLSVLGIRALSRRPIAIPSAAASTVEISRHFETPSMGAVVSHLLAIFTVLTIPFSSQGNDGLNQLLFLLLLAPVMGFFARTPRISFWKGFALGVLATLVTGMLASLTANVWAIWLAVGGMVYGVLCWCGGLVSDWVRRQKKTHAPYDRTQMLAQLFELQTALEKHQEVRTFLSVDVVGSSAMKAAANELEVEYSFRQYQAWVAEKVRGLGGELQFTAGDGAMAMFRDSSAATMAAKELQLGLPIFNSTRNRLTTPFTIRCGIAEGRIGLDAHAEIGHIQSPVLDRAAFLQKYAEPGSVVVAKELLGTAMPVLGSLRHRELIDGTEVYAWP